jgi:hypothetical protein
MMCKGDMSRNVDSALARSHALRDLDGRRR